MFKIIVGIRTYNVQHYIEQCLNSVYNQSIKNDVKIVLVDDCSTDNTLIVIDEWVLEHLDFAIDVYINLKNCGPGVMLMLLQKYITNTEYVILLDGDDFYTKSNCLEYMYNFIKKHDYDFVKFTKDAWFFHVKNLIKLELYKQIKFNPFRFGEDHYEFWLLRITTNYVLHEYDFYYYRNNFNSLVRTGHSIQRLTEIFNDIYYWNIPEASKQLECIFPDPEYKEIYDEMCQVKYEIHPIVLVLSKNTNLTEFINHYYSIGFENIFVLDNNNQPILYDNVTIIPYNNIPLVTFPEFQATAYDYALNVIRDINKYNYVLVVDDDEYLQLKSHNNIVDFINEEMLLHGTYNCDFVWETYDDNDILYEKDVKDSILKTYTRKLQINKFDDANHQIWTKPLYRIREGLDYTRSLNPGHNPTDKYYKKYIINPEKAVLKHYRTQCLETFLKSKVLLKNFRKGKFGEKGLLTSYFHINTYDIHKLNAYVNLCNQYNIDYDKEEYNKYLNLCIKKSKLAVILLILNQDEFSLIDQLNYDNFDVYVVTHLYYDKSLKYPIYNYGTNIYDCLTNFIKGLENEYCAIIFPSSIIYPEKFTKLLTLLQNNNLDVITCNCLYNNELNTKPIISTVMFRTNSIKNLDLMFEQYYESFDKFFVNINHLSCYNINEILLEENFIQEDCKYNIHNLYNQQTLNKNLTAIITFQNEGYEIEKTIQSIRATTLGVPIILINDFSTDEYNYQLLELKYNCIYVENSKNLGVAGSRDLGVSLCKTDYFVILDGHMRFYNMNWDELIVEILKEKPNSIICSNSTSITKYGKYGYSSELLRNSITYAGYVDLESENYYRSNWSFKAIDESNITRIPSVLGACYASSKQHWELICGLQGLIKYGYDEALMSIKTWLVGGECLLIKDFYVGHLYRDLQPYFIDSSHTKANQIFLAYLFDYRFNEIKETIDPYIYNKAIKLLDFNEIDKLKNKLKDRYVKSFDYFLSINNIYTKYDKNSNT